MFLKKILSAKWAHYFLGLSASASANAPFFSERERNFATERVQVWIQYIMKEYLFARGFSALVYLKV
jgi:hypothetical protein